MVDAERRDDLKEEETHCKTHSFPKRRNVLCWSIREPRSIRNLGEFDDGLLAN
jgi:hypothetical protein